MNEYVSESLYKFAAIHICSIYMINKTFLWILRATGILV